MKNGKLIDGEIDSMSYFLDFPYEVETRYRKMVREDKEYADLMLSDAQFKRLIRKKYKYIKDVVSEGFF